MLEMVKSRTGHYEIVRRVEERTQKIGYIRSVDARMLGVGQRALGKTWQMSLFDWQNVEIDGQSFAVAEVWFRTFSDAKAFVERGLG